MHSDAPTASGPGADDSSVVLVPLSNPRTEDHLVSLGAAVAARRGGRVVAVTVERVPDQTSLAAAREQVDDEAATSLLESARRHAAAQGVPVETHTVFSHRRFRAIFDAVERHGADLCVMGWPRRVRSVAGRAESVLAELARPLPCDLLVLRDRGYDPSRVLLATTGGPHADLAAEAVSALAATGDASVTLVHVAADRADGAAFLASWAADHDLEGADRLVATDDIETTIAAAAREHTMVVMGAAESGVLVRLVRGSPVSGVLEAVDRPVLVAERRTDRGPLGRLVGRP